MAIEHLVLLALDRDRLTEDHLRDVLELADRVRAELGIKLENQVSFTEPEGSSVVAALSHWHFSSAEDLRRFRESKAHLDHLAFMRPVLLDKQILDRET